MPHKVRRVGRKRFAETVKYLKSIISDERKGDRLRMQAVQTLVAIYDRNDKLVANDEWRRKAAENGVQPATIENPAEPPKESLDAFLARVQAERERNVNARIA